MRILFYSKTCDFCTKLLEYINKNNLNEYFNIICIDDDTIKIPNNITVVPTIIDEEIEAPLEGKKAFEYVINQKYFNHPTNNIEFIKNGVPKPTIEEDKKAINSRSGSGFIFVSDENNTTERDEKNNFDKVFSVNKDLEIVSKQKLETSRQNNSSSQQKLLLNKQQLQPSFNKIENSVNKIESQSVNIQSLPINKSPHLPVKMDALLRLKGRR
jgi:hypothetical protein